MSDRVAVVTGAGGGIGRAIALRLGREGYAVACSGRRLDALAETRDAIAAAGGEASAVVCDLSDAAAVDRLADAVGPADLLVCNSGIAGPDGPLWAVEPERWHETIDVNLNGVYRACRAFVPGMVERGRGCVIAIGSVSGARPLPGRSPYSASKLGLVGLMRALAVDGAPHGVRVNMVSPGATGGERLERVLAGQAATQGRTVEEVRAAMLAATPGGRFVDADEVAAVVAYLAGDDAAAVTGEELTVTGGAAR